MKDQASVFSSEQIKPSIQYARLIAERMGGGSEWLNINELGGVDHFAIGRRNISTIRK